MSSERYSRDEARARFDAAIDGELGDDERARFDATVAADEELHREFERHREVVIATKSLGAALPEVDLLASVQSKLRARSGGKFYRDRFAARTSSSALMLAIVSLSAVFLLGALGLLAYQMGWLDLASGSHEPR